MYKTDVLCIYICCFITKVMFSCWWSIVRRNPPLFHGHKTQNFKYFGVTTLTFWDHVTSSVTWPSDSAYAISYWWSIATMRLSWTVTEIFL